MVGCNQSKPHAIIAVLVSALVFATSTLGVEWKTFKGGNTRMSFTTQSVSLPARKIAWSMKLGGSITTTPIFSKGYVFIGNENGRKSKYRCIKDSKIVWEFPNNKLRDFVNPRTNEKPWPNGELDFDGTDLKIESTIFDREVFVPWGSKLMIINEDSGKLNDYIDLRELKHSGNINTAPLVMPSQKLILCGSTNGYVYGFDMDPDSGEPLVKWRVPENGAGGVISSAVAASTTDNYVYFGSSSGMVYCYQLLWNAKTGQLPPKIWEKKLDGQITSTPAVVGNTVVFTTKDTGKVYCLNASSGDVIWDAKTQYRILSSPAVSGNNAIIISGRKVICYDRNTGYKNWDQTLGDECYSTPTVNNDYVFLTCYDMKFYVLKIDNGAVMCSKKVSSQIKSSPSLDSGKIFFGDQSGTLYAIEEGDEEPKADPSMLEIDIPVVYNDSKIEYEEFFIDNSGGKNLTGQVSFSRDWVTTTKTNFSIPADGGTQIPILIDPVGQIAGQYKVMMKIDTNANDVNIPITMSIVRKPDTVISVTIGRSYITINGGSIPIDAPPWETETGIVMVPVRVITESFGCNLQWIAVTRTVVLYDGRKGITVTFRIGSRFPDIEYDNGIMDKNTVMPYPATIVNGRTTIPIDFFTRAFDADIDRVDDDLLRIVIKHD